MMRPERSSKRVCSSSAIPMPHTAPPRYWLFAVFSLRMRPAPNALTNLASRTVPNSGSTRTSANCAPNECIA